MKNSTAKVYDELLNVNSSINRALAVVDDFPPYLKDETNEQLREDLERTQQTIDNARNVLSIASMLQMTNEPINNWDVDKALKNGVDIDVQNADVDLYYYDGLYTDKLRNKINRKIRPNEITYFVCSDIDGVIWYGTDREQARNEYKDAVTICLLNGDDQSEIDDETDNDESNEQYDDENEREYPAFKFLSKSTLIYYDNVLIDFDDVVSRAVEYSITKTDDDIYGNMNEFIDNVISARKEFDNAPIEKQISSIVKNRIKIRYR